MFIDTGIEEAGGVVISIALVIEYCSYGCKYFQM
jgi:hypothetical protein